MSLTEATLREQQQKTEQELEQAKAHVYRCDGALTMLNHLLAECAKPDDGETSPVLS